MKFNGQDRRFLEQLQNDAANQEESFSSFENILKLENTDSLLFSKINLTEPSMANRKIKSKKRSRNEQFLEEQIEALIKEKPIWLKKSLMEKLKSRGGNVESSHILKVGRICRLIGDSLCEAFLQVLERAL